MARRQALLDAKLRSLVGRSWGASALQEATAGVFPGGATLRSGRRGWVLAEERPERSLGGSLAWAGRAGVEDLALLVPRAAGSLARRATGFARAPEVWEVDGSTLRRALPAPIEPERAVPAAALALLDVIRAAGADPVAERGVLTGEVLGLEVARVAAEGAEAWLEVGVGKHDREAQRLVHGGRSPLEALVAAVAEVRRLRVAGVPSHPANLLSPERWLRTVLVARPEVVGARRLVAVASTVVREDLRSRAPASALGIDHAGEPVVVVCSVGIDPDLVPVAADVRAAAAAALLGPPPWAGHPWVEHGLALAAAGRRARLVVAVPAGDDHGVTRALAAALSAPAELRTVPGDWREIGPAGPAPSVP